MQRARPCLIKLPNLWYNVLVCGGVAQLGEHLVRNEGVRGSNPLVSTKIFGTFLGICLLANTRTKLCIFYSLVLFINASHPISLLLMPLFRFRPGIFILILRCSVHNGLL